MLNQQETTFYGYETLLDRLVHATRSGEKKIVFLVGSPASAPMDGNLGVPDVDGVIELVHGQFRDDQRAYNALIDELQTAPGNPYQVALSFLLGRRGQDAVNELIRIAVLAAREDSADVITRLTQAADKDASAQELENETEKWSIPRCQQELAALCINEPKVFGQVQLTTNFDPLLSLAIQKAGGDCYRSVLSRDGNLAQAQGKGCHIVHLHGYWRGTDTLHTPRQLTHARPRLKASLLELLRNSILVPVAYSGWDDVFTSTLSEILAEDGSRPEVLWTYFGDIEADLIAQNNRQLNHLAAGLDRGRLNLYKGTNCHELFSDLRRELGHPNHGDTGVTSVSNTQPTPLGHVFCELTTVQFTCTPKDSTPHGDAIPTVNDLVGRDRELGLLTDIDNRLVAISGIGGQGKSSLAAYHAMKCKKNGGLKFVEWRDCREQSDTLHTILLKTYQSLTGRTESIEVLKELSIEQLSSELCKLLESENGLIVFDNVDHYVDLETGGTLGALEAFLDAIHPERLKSQIIFTSRPPIKFESLNAASFTLKGLSGNDARVLFEQKSGADISENDFEELLNVTEGHPLWISLIASRVRHQDVPIDSILREITSGKGELPARTLLSIWNTLNDKQKTVLRTLAELERPLPEGDVGDIDFELNFNQFSKALKALKALGLVELRQQENGTDALDLHPLIRQYIRTNFQRIERARFISKIIRSFDRRLSKLREIFKTNVPISALEIWTHKIDLSLNNNENDPAIDALEEIYSNLVDNGLAEEFIRLSTRIFEQIDWPTTCATSAVFPRLWSHSIKTLVELGDFTRADLYLDKYASAIQGTGPQFINLCDSRCYRYWFSGDFEQAVFHGEKGSTIKKQSSVDTTFDSEHNLALAWRDSGRIDDALTYFTGHHSEEDILNSSKLDLHEKGSFYGNIGRCYFLRGEVHKALVCYRKSAKLLEQARDEALNRGYIRQWVGQALNADGQLEDGAIFLRAAQNMWHGFVPQRATATESELQSIIDSNPKLARVLSMPSWRLENRFQQWVNG